MSEEKRSNGPLGTTEEKIALKKAEAEQMENDLDSSTVKFINGGSAAAHVTVDADGKAHISEENAFCGLSKEELMKYAKDPFWVKVRWALLILFWVAWFGMLAAAIIIIVVSPKCPPRPELAWWQKSLSYQIYPKSFKDSNGDGIGDINGIKEKLDYLKELNISVVYMSSLYPNFDMKEIDEMFGTMEEFEKLRVAMHKKGIRLVMDFIPNHTNLNHTWFKESQNGNEEFKNYYIWHPGTDVGGSKQPPNNWLSVHGGSAWKLDQVRNEFYLHQFSEDEPDLNLTNPAVLEQLDETLTFWLKKGVDGFRIRALANLVEIEDYSVDEIRSDQNVPVTDYKYLVHNLTTYQPAMFDLLTRWRTILDKYSEEEGRKHPRLLVGDVDNVEEDILTNLYEYDGKPGLNMPLNSQLLTITKSCDAECVKKQIRDWLKVVPAGQTEKDKWTSWQLGNDDKSRVSSRTDQKTVNAMNMLMMTLPGTAFVYYGEEIGMHDVYTNVPASSKQRTPMQWTSGENAGFSTGNPWLQVALDYKLRNVQAQVAHGSGITQLEVFKSLAAIQESPSLQWGVLEDVYVTSDIYSYVRQAEGFPGFLVAINFGSNPTTVNFHAASPKLVPTSGKMVTSTENFETPSRMADYKPGSEVTLEAIYLEPNEGIVVTFDFME